MNAISTPPRSTMSSKTVIEGSFTTDNKSMNATTVTGMPAPAPAPAPNGNAATVPNSVRSQEAQNMTDKTVRPRGRPKKFHEWDEASGKYIFTGTPEDLKPPEKEKKKKINDPNKPKRGMSPFLYFGKEARPIIMKEHPEWTFVQVQKELSARWQKMTDAEQQPYKDISIAKMTEYKENMKSYIAPTEEQILAKIEQAKLEKQRIKSENKAQKNRAISIHQLPSAAAFDELKKKQKKTSLKQSVSAKKTGLNKYFKKQKEALRTRYPHLNDEQRMAYATEEWKALSDEAREQYEPKSKGKKAQKKRRADDDKLVTPKSKVTKGRIGDSSVPLSMQGPLRDEQLAASGLSQLSVQQELYEAQLLQAQQEEQTEQAPTSSSQPGIMATPSDSYIRMGLMQNPNFTQGFRFQSPLPPQTQGRFTSPGPMPALAYFQSPRFQSPAAALASSNTGGANGNTEDGFKYQQDMFNYQMHLMAMMAHAQAQTVSPDHQIISPVSNLQRSFAFSPTGERPSTAVPSANKVGDSGENNARIESSIGMQNDLHALQMALMQQQEQDSRGIVGGPAERPSPPASPTDTSRRPSKRGTRQPSSVKA